MLLSVIIVSYNVKYFLEQCLCSLQAALTDIDAEVLVIDNCSSDGSIAYLQPLFPRVTFIQNSTNDGFSRANNKALQLAKGEHILFLNPDTILAEDTLQHSINFFKTHANAGGVGVRMMDGAGKFLPESKRAFPAPLTSFYKLFGLAALFPTSAIFNRYALGFLPEEKIHEVDVLSGAFMIVRKTVLDIIGGFDEQFFMYAEDIDLSYRIQKAGYKNYYLGSTTIIHFKGESTKKGSLNYVRLFYQAMRLFVKKHYSGAGAWLLNKGLYAGILLRQMMAALALPFYRKNNNNITITERIYISGDALQIDSATNIIRKNQPKAALQYITDIGQMAVTKNNTLVLCTGSGLSYKQAVQTIQAHVNTALFLWCGEGTHSIAGNNKKNASGVVWY